LLGIDVCTCMLVPVHDDGSHTQSVCVCVCAAARGVKWDCILMFGHSNML
jgi:hypothetical protein